jgi:hypothetical protein
MYDLPELITNKIWRYYWKNKKINYLEDIKNKKHRLIKDDDNDRFQVWADTYNFLRIMNGMNGLTYSI